MAQDVDRNTVFQTTRVRTALKNDVSWIQGSKQGNKEQDNARTEQTKPAPVRQNSYVQLTAKKFESVDPPPNPPLQNTEFIPSEGDSANQENCEVVPPHKDAQPEGSTVETTDDTKSQAVTDKPIQNGEAQPGTTVENTTAENKEENADTAVELSNVEQSEGAAEVSADVHVEEHVQNGEAEPVSSTKENPESVSPVAPTEQQLVNTTSEIKGEYANAAADKSYVEQNEVKVSADAHVEDPFAETSAATDIGENKDSAVVPAVLLVEPKIEDQPSTETEPAKATNVENSGVESTVQPAEGSSEKCPPEQAAGDIVKAVDVAVVESAPDNSDVINTMPGAAAVLQDSVETVPDFVANPVSESPTHPAAEAATDRSCETGPSAETAEAVVEVKVESLPAPLALTNTAGDEAASQDIVKEVPDLVADTVSKSPTQPTAEAVVEPVESKVVSAASAEPVLQTRADEVVKCEVRPVQSTVAEQSVQPATENASDQVVELSVMDALEPGTASNDNLSYNAMELTDALDIDVKPPASDAAPEPAGVSEQSHTKEKQLIQQSDHTNNSEISQKSVEEQRSTRTLSEPRNTKAVCSFCDKTIEGRVKLIFNEPLMDCHPDCLKCGVCAKALGDLLTPMFLCNQVIQCDGCFAIALKT